MVLPPGKERREILQEPLRSVLGDGVRVETEASTSEVDGVTPWIWDSAGIASQYSLVEELENSFTHKLGYLRSKPGEDPTPSVTSSVVAGDWTPPSRRTLPLLRVQLEWKYLFSSRL